MENFHPAELGAPVVNGLLTGTVLVQQPRLVWSGLRPFMILDWFFVESRTFHRLRVFYLIPFLSFKPFQLSGARITNPRTGSSSFPKLSCNLAGYRYVGASLDCGCGFRVCFISEWYSKPEEWMREPGECSLQRTTFKITKGFTIWYLLSFLAVYPVELYNHWDSGECDETRFRETIPAGRILDAGFWFCERSCYGAASSESVGSDKRRLSVSDL